MGIPGYNDGLGATSRSVFLAQISFKIHPPLQVLQVSRGRPE